MSNIRYADGVLTFSEPTTIVCADRKSASRIISHLITRGEDFAVQHKEAEWCIFLHERVDLDRLRRRVTASFELWV